MVLPNQLDLQRSVESTLNRAKGWLLSKYPSSQTKNNLHIEVTYPNNDITKVPERVRILRGKNSVEVRKTTLTTVTQDNLPSYSLDIHCASNESYHIEETLGQRQFETGNKRLLLAVKKDEFGKYISLIEKDDPRCISLHYPKWDLTKIMQNARS